MYDNNNMYLLFCGKKKFCFTKNKILFYLFCGYTMTNRIVSKSISS